MVYTTSYYAVYALTKVALKLSELFQGRWREKGEEGREKRGRRGPVDLYFVQEPTGPALVLNNEYRVKLPMVLNPVPALAPSFRIARKEEGGSATGRRMYFSYTEAASDDWFKEVERLAKEIEKRERGGED
ncbi:MAG: hypothetical protein QW794_02295 [Thermosphaera sp.]